MVVRRCRVVVFVVIICMLKAPFCTPFRLYLFFLPKYRRIICTTFLCNKKYRSPCSFKRKGPSHLLRFALDSEYSATFEKERMFLHLQRFQNFRSAVFSFFATNFHLFCPTMSFETPIFLACELSGKESRHYICVLLCAVQDAQCNRRILADVIVYVFAH